MIPGSRFLRTVQVTNVRSILMKNLMDSIFGCIVWYVVGYGLYLGDHPVAGGDVTKFLVSDYNFFGMKICLADRNMRAINERGDEAIIGLELRQMVIFHIIKWKN